MDQKWVLVIIAGVVLVVLIWSLRRKSKTIQKLLSMIPLPPSMGGRPRRGSGQKHP